MATKLILKNSIKCFTEKHQVLDKTSC